MITIIILASVFVGIAALFIVASKGGEKLKKERTEKLAKAEPGKAKILSYTNIFGKGTTAQGEYHIAKFNLEVSSAYKATYQAETVWNIFAMGAPLVQQGCEVNVKIDADDPDIIYPDINSVEYSWTQAIIEAGHKKDKSFS